MISSETPDKLRQIIMDTWPQLYLRPQEKMDNTSKHKYSVIKDNKK